MREKIDGRVVKSDFEYDLYTDIVVRTPDSKVEYETEKLHYVIEADYSPDLIITFPSGRKRYIEAKGNGRAFDASVQKKMIAVKKQHPDIDIRIVFYKNGIVGNKRKDGTYRHQSDWAEKHGFLYAISKIPNDWLIDE